MKTPAYMRLLGWLSLALLLALPVACSEQDPSGNGEDPSGAGPKGNDPFGKDDDKFNLLDNAALEVSPKELNFSGQVATESKEVRIKNSGDKGVLTLTGIRLSDSSSAAFSVTQPEKMTLNALESVVVKVSYTVALDPAGSGDLIISHDSNVSGPVTVPLRTATTGGALKVAPATLSFSDVPIGTSATKSIAVANVGSGAFRLTEIAMVESSSALDFTVDPAGQLPLTLEPAAVHEITVTYTPDGEGDDIGQVSIRTDLAEKSEAIVPVTGNVTGPKLLAVPAIVNFEVVPLGGTETIEVMLQNAGSADLTLDSVAESFGTNPAVSIVGAPAGEVVLAPTESLTFDVTFAPTENVPYSVDPLGGVVIASNDISNPQMVLPIYGNVGAPSLQVTPLFVDFGLVAKDDVVLREVSMLNSGKHPLEVKAITFLDDSGSEFKNVGYDVQGWAVPGTIEDDQHVLLKLSFTNTLGSAADASGKLVIESSDPEKPSIEVVLSAKRAGQKQCKVELVPSALNYGIVPHGHTKTMPITIKNVGSGPCSFKKAKTFNCGGGFFGTPGACTDGIGGSATNFKVVGQPPPIPAGIAQGGKATVQIMFVPPEDAPLIEFFDTYNGAFQIEVTDPSNGDALIQLPQAAAPASLPVNLQAQSGISSISVIPAQVDFGLITIGCTSEETRVTIYNNGNAPLKLSDIVLEDCTPEFEITQMPGLPLEVTQTNPVDVFVLYTPQQVGKANCTLSIISDDSDQPLLTVPLQGKGTYDSEWTDTYTQLSGQLVDVLFVVDNSGSMGDDQKNLSNNFGSLIQEAKKWGTDYHLGVITTDAQAADHSGKLQGNPRIVTTATTDKFKDTVKVGDNGSGTEEGLEAAHQALSMPHVYTSTKTCAADADCSAPSMCINGTCGGWNAGFLRDDAALEIVFVSDEEDQSPAPLTFYIDFFKSIKGFANESLMHAHAIVGPEPDGCGQDPNDPNSMGGAAAGKRYIEVAKQTGGQVGSICDASFASVLATIGEVAFGLKQQFFLSAAADPPTVKVWVSGNACANGWKYDQASNSVIFELNGPCMPQEGQEIKIYYKMLCLQEG